MSRPERSRGAEDGGRDPAKRAKKPGVARARRTKRSGGRADIGAELFRGCERLSPGTPETVRAIAKEAEIGAASLVLELAAGLGGTACQLAREVGCHVIATDASAPAVEALRARARRERLSKLVAAHRVDLLDLPRPFEPRTFDVVLCECSLHLGGLERTLRAARELLDPEEGRIAFTELVWVRPPPRPLLEHWDRARSDEKIRLQDDVVFAMGVAGFGDGLSFELGEEAFAAYYAPIRANLARLRAAGVADPVLDLMELEIRLYDEGGGREALACAAFIGRPDAP